MKFKALTISAALLLSSFLTTAFAVEHDHGPYTYTPVEDNGRIINCPCEIDTSSLQHYSFAMQEFSKQEELQDLLRDAKKNTIPKSLFKDNKTNKKQPITFNYKRHCMSFEEALVYQKAHNKDIHAEYETRKDISGEKDKWRYFSFLSSDGLLNTGNTNIGIADRTFLNYVINYGFSNNPIEPYACIVWEADLAGDPTKGYEPQVFRILFSDNYIKTFNLQGWEYRKKYVSGIFFSSLAHSYNGIIKLSRFDLFELSQHGQVVSASVDAGNGEVKHFFYTGNKNKEDKELLTRAFQHSLILLGIDPAKMKDEYEAYEKQKEEARIAKIRAEVEAEIKAEQEREAIKQQILAEMKQKELNKVQ